jgi:hypothetical protein
MRDGAGRHGTTLLLVAVVIAALLMPAARSTAQVDPTGFPPEIDPYQPYEPQRICDPAPKPGVVDFANLLL